MRPPLFVLTLLAAPLAHAAPLLESDVLPILAKSCMGCHGGLRQKGKLDLRTVPAMLKGGKSGPSIKPGDPAHSSLWTRIERDEMPPGERKLSAAEKEQVKKWISAGLPAAEAHKKDDPLLDAGRKHNPKEVAAAIDRHIAAKLAELKLEAAPQCDDAELLRRLYLDLAGRVPTAEQAAAFLDSKDANKRAKLIDDLLASKDFGEQLGRTWREWICPPELPSDGNGGRQPHKEAQALGKWIGERLHAGDGWDKVVRSILTVEGDIKGQPQVIFFGLAGEGGKLSPDGSARAAASLFMGVQLQCAQCHDDPYRDWSQKDHWALAAFFSRVSGGFTKVSEAGKGDARVTIPKTAFINAGTSVPAAFPGGKPFAPRATGSLREQLADWLTAKDNPYFARAFANRAWFYFFARGLVNPVDDLRELNPPSHPGLMKLLENELHASDFDVKHLFRCICNSAAYQRTSRTAKTMDEPAVAALTAAFGRMPLRIMTADQLYDSLRQAYGDPKLDLRPALDEGNTRGESAAIADPYLEFLRRFGTNKEDAADFTHGIPQMLTMINHPRLLAGSKALDAWRKARRDATDAEVVEWLYLSTLSRRPTAAEQASAGRYLAKSPGNFAGVLWMLANRTELLLVR
jgi:hypothetical protein